MGAPEQFAGWGMYDNLAVCLNCKTQHLISKGEQITPQPWLDWQTKHAGHITFITAYSQRGKLEEMVGKLQHNANVKVAYAASAAYTITLASLASDTNLLAGRESDGLSNTVNLYLDELVAGVIRTGTTPTDVRTIEVHAVGTRDDTPTYPDVFDGADSAETITSSGIKDAICTPIALMATNNTSNRDYWFKPVGLRRLFGEGLPSRHVIFVTHNTAVALNATGGQHVISHTPVYATVT